jgi:hypothetical protein
VRPYTVPERLEYLTGPDRGEVQPPPTLTGALRRSYRLDDEHDVELLYRTVIREASTVDELARYLNADVLKECWSRMVLPPRCRTLWEQRFPELAILIQRSSPEPSMRSVPPTSRLATP